MRWKSTDRILATSKGFQIFTTEPFAKSYEAKEGNTHSQIAVVLVKRDKIHGHFWKGSGL
jgi:hypothetical protein